MSHILINLIFQRNSHECSNHRGEQEIQLTDRTHVKKKKGIEEHFKIDLGMMVVGLYIKQPIGFSWIEYQNNTGMYSS